MPAIVAGIAWLAGIWLAARVGVPPAFWLLLGLAGVTASAALRRHVAWAVALFGVSALGFGGLRYRYPDKFLLVCFREQLGKDFSGQLYQTAVPTIDAGHIAFYNGSRDLTFTGLVSAEPDIRDRYINLRVSVDSLILPDGGSLPVAGDVLVRTARFPVTAYGSQVQVRGQLETPPEFAGFSYREYLARRGIHSLVNQPRLAVLAVDQGQPLYHAIYAFKARAQATINQLIPEPAAALLTGILLGNDKGLPPDLAEDFRITGMTHIIAISGEIATTLLAQREKFITQQLA